MIDLIIIEKDTGVLRLRMNRADKKNALTRDMYSAMAYAIETAEHDPEVRVILFEGTAGCFCAGNDLKDFQEQPPRDKAAPVYRFITALARSTVPMVAAVDGVAVGIGTTMLLHCDLVYATDRTRFQLPFVNLGLLPEAGSTYLLPKLVGAARAAELLMTGRPFKTQEALELGIINGICAPEELTDQALQSAREFAEKPPQSLRKIKKLLKSDSGKVEDRIQWEILEFSEQLDSAECKEALQAFQEKRKPDFTKIRSSL